MITVSKQFEFHLLGTSAPEGQLDADHLLAIVTSLRDVATKIGRAETGAEVMGRAPARVHRVAGLFIGLAPGSTTVVARRIGAGEGVLDFDLPDEASFDASFEALVESIADDQRPSWVTDSLSRATEDLTTALQHAAPTVEFKVDGESRRSFDSVNIHRETWRVASSANDESISFVGRLYTANLNTHRFGVQDDVGHQVALPDIRDDTHIAKLFGSYVVVTGAPVADPTGRVTHIHQAVVEAAPEFASGLSLQDAMSLDELILSAPGPDPNGGIEISDDEWDDIWAALHT